MSTNKFTNTKFGQNVITTVDKYITPSREDKETRYKIFCYFFLFTTIVLIVCLMASTDHVLKMQKQFKAKTKK